MTENAGLQPDMRAELFAYRDWNSEHNGLWRLCWHVANDCSYINAQGECSAIFHKTMREAIAYGQKHYSATAKRWGGIGYTFPNDSTH